MIQPDLKVYESVGMRVTKLVLEPESAEYSACRFSLDTYNVIFRNAKITPKKCGQFVTLWKRLNQVIQPLDYTDNIDFLIISASDEVNYGHFIFSRHLLIEKRIISTKNRIGKLAFRLYPPWTKPIAKQALEAQKWQLASFFSISPKGTVSPELVYRLFNNIP